MLTFVSFRLLFTLHFNALHYVNFVSPWASRTASPSHLFKVGERIQRAPEIRFPLYRIRFVHSLVVSPRVHRPLPENFSVILHRPSMAWAMLPGNLKQSALTFDPFQSWDFFVIEFLLQPVSKTQFLLSARWFAVVVHFPFCASVDSLQLNSSTASSFWMERLSWKWSSLKFDFSTVPEVYSYLPRNTEHQKIDWKISFDFRTYNNNDCTTVLPYVGLNHRHHLMIRSLNVVYINRSEGKFPELWRVFFPFPRGYILLVYSGLSVK